MRRTPGLSVLSRREILAAAGCAGLAGLTFGVGCSDGQTGVVQTGGLGGPDGGGHDGQLPPFDAPANADAAIAMLCSGAATDVGPASTFVVNSPKYFSAGNFFVARDAGGLYALTAKCTHDGVTCVVSGTRLFCPRHGALFTFNGAVISGPVFVPLKHYSMCNLSNGHVAVQTNTVVTATARLVA